MSRAQTGSASRIVEEIGPLEAGQPVLCQRMQNIFIISNQCEVSCIDVVDWIGALQGFKNTIVQVGVKGLDVHESLLAGAAGNGATVVEAPRRPERTYARCFCCMDVFQVGFELAQSEEIDI